MLIVSLGVCLRKLRSIQPLRIPNASLALNPGFNGWTT